MLIQIRLVQARHKEQSFCSPARLWDPGRAEHDFGQHLIELAAARLRSVRRSAGAVRMPPGRSLLGSHRGRSQGKALGTSLTWRIDPD